MCVFPSSEETGTTVYFDGLNGNFLICLDSFIYSNLAAIKHLLSKLLSQCFVQVRKNNRKRGDGFDVPVQSSPPFSLYLGSWWYPCLSGPEVDCITYVHFPSETKFRNDATMASARIGKCWFEGSLVKYKEMVNEGVGQLPL